MTPDSSPLTLYPLLVLPEQRILGWGKALLQGKTAREYSTVPTLEALTGTWETDAHLALYLVRPLDGGPWLPSCPRLTKMSAEWAVESRTLQEQNLEVLCPWVCCDFDTREADTGQPNHTPLADLPDRGQEWLRIHLDRLRALEKETGLSFARYSTRAGGRILAPLSHPLPPSDFEVLASDLVQTLRHFDINADPLEHWTALFRLPRVLRSGTYTSSRLSLNCSPVPSETYLGTGQSRDISPVLPAPDLDPLPEGTDPWALVSWAGIENLREILQSGGFILDPDLGYATYRSYQQAVAQISSRMPEPREDVVAFLFQKSLEAMRAAGSRGTVQAMPGWIRKVTRSDYSRRVTERQELETIRAWLSPKPVPSPVNAPPSPAVSRAWEEYALREVEKAIRGITRAKSLGALRNSATVAGRVSAWLEESAVLGELAAHTPEKYRNSEGEGALRAGMELGKRDPLDVPGEVARELLIGGTREP